MVLNKLKDTIEQKREEKSSHIVALDIGTEYVKALIGKIEKDQVKIVGVGRQHQRLSDMHSGAIADIAGVVENCDKALSEAENQAKVDARNTVIGIAGELVKGTTTTIRYKRPDGNKPLEMDEIEEMMEKVQKRAYERAKAQLSWEAGNPDLEIKLVNSAIVSLHIDGYKINNPIGFQGKDVAIQLYTAFAPMVHIGALERTADELDLDLVAVAAEPFAVARSVTASDSNSNFSAVLIDVGGGTTDIAVVNEGGVEGTKMFGIGGRSFTNTIAGDMECDFKKAEELKLQVGKNELDLKDQQLVEKSLSKTLDVWASGVELALNEFDSLDHLPNRILLCGGGASLRQLVDTLKDDEWYKGSPFTRQPSVQYIDPKQVIDIVDDTGKISDHTFVTAMGLLRIGLDTTRTTDDKSQSVKEKLNKLLRI